MTTYNVSYKLLANTTQFTNAMQKVNTGVNKSTANIKKNAVALQSANKPANQLTGAIKGLAVAYLSIASSKAVINTIADFGSSMSKVKGLTQASALEMKNLRKQAKDLGRSTIFSAGQVADGMGFMAMAGISSRDILKTMPAVLDLAAVGQLDLATSADIATNIMGQFGATAKELPHIMDVMAVAASSSNTSITELGGALNKAGPLAKNFNIDIETIGGALGVLANQGLKGSEAGSGIRRVLANLVNPTKKAKEELAKLGITQEDINVKTLGLSQVLKNLNPILKSNKAQAVVFGKEGIVPASILIKSTEELAKLEKKMINSKGAAKKMAKTFNDDLKGDMKGFMSTIEGLILLIGDSGLTGALRGSLQGFTNFLRVIGGVEVANMSEGMRGLAKAIRIVGFVGGKALGGLWTGLKVIGVLVTTIADLFYSLGETIGKALKPLTDGLLGSKLGKFFTGEGEEEKRQKQIKELGEQKRIIRIRKEAVASGLDTNEALKQANLKRENQLQPRVDKLDTNNNTKPIEVRVDFANAPKGTTITAPQQRQSNFNVGVNMSTALDLD